MTADDTTSSVELVQPLHNLSCETWVCSHCTVCGVATLYGSRCFAHDATKPPDKPAAGES